MKTSSESDILWSRISDSIARTLGLHFPPQRWSDLQRGLADAATELGFSGAAACADWLLSTNPTKAQLRLLASYLTVGETYFFREKQTFEALAYDVLPDLVRSRRGSSQRLRLWSAACCTGEEPYSLAILLNEIIPDLANWQVTILATDLNDRFLQRAAAGVYGEWSFRETPPWFKERYFERTADHRYAVLPEFKKRVTFANLNLVEDVYPSLATDTNAMDVILCRNALMYFTPEQVRKVVGNLRHALIEEGWLVVGQSETSHVTFSSFAPVNLAGAILYRKSRLKEAPDTAGHDEANESSLRLPEAVPSTVISEDWEFYPLPSAALPQTDVPRFQPTDAESLYREGNYANAAEALLSSLTPEAQPDPASFSLLARALANLGQLSEALIWCDRWIAADKLDPSGHYLRAVLLQELGDPAQARRSLQRTIYLDRDFVLAHFALGNIARGDGDLPEADRHFTNALHLLRAFPPNEPLPAADGLTANRLTQIITSIITMEPVP